MGSRAEPRRRRRDAHCRRGAGEHDDALRRRSLARLRRHVHGGPVPACRLRSGVRGRRHGRCSARAAERWPWAFTPNRGAWWGRRRTRRSQASIRSSRTTTASSGPRPRSGTSSTAPWWLTHRHRDHRAAATASQVTSTWAVGAWRSSTLDLYSYPSSGHLHVARLRRRRQPRHLADADAAATTPGRDRRGVRGPHRKHPDAGCLLDRLAAGRCRRRDPRPGRAALPPVPGDADHDGQQRDAVRGRA